MALGSACQLQMCDPYGHRLSGSKPMPSAQGLSTFGSLIGGYK